MNPTCCKTTLIQFVSRSLHVDHLMFFLTTYSREQPTSPVFLLNCEFQDDKKAIYSKYILTGPATTPLDKGEA